MNDKILSIIDNSYSNTYVYVVFYITISLFNYLLLNTWFLFLNTVINTWGRYNFYANVFMFLSKYSEVGWLDFTITLILAT